MTLKQRAAEAFAAVEADLVEISHWMYHHPELAYMEHESSARLAGFLAGHGFEVTHPAHGLDTAFEATAGTSGPSVVICCEYDALPGVGHACGHNIIATAAVGAGVALAGLADELGIRVTVMGTPAEEAGGGKVDLLNVGAFEGAAAAMMVHPVAEHDVVDGKALAIQAFVVEFHGRASHAAGAPQLGINALDAFEQRLDASPAPPADGQGAFDHHPRWRGGERDPLLHPIGVDDPVHHRATSGGAGFEGHRLFRGCCEGDRMPGRDHRRWAPVRRAGHQSPDGRHLCGQL
jgi:hypothetical protein